MPLADCSVRRALKREGVSLWFLAACGAVEAKLGLVSLTFIPLGTSSPAAQRKGGCLVLRAAGASPDTARVSQSVRWRDDMP